MHALDIAPLCSESPPQKRSGIARVLKGFHSFTCTPTRSSTIGMSHTCLCLPSCSWYSFTDPGGMEGWVYLGVKKPRPRFEPATSRLQIWHSTTQPLAHQLSSVTVGTWSDSYTWMDNDTCVAAVRSRWCWTDARDLATQCHSSQFKWLNRRIGQSSVVDVAWYFGTSQWSVLSCVSLFYTHFAAISVSG